MLKNTPLVKRTNDDPFTQVKEVSQELDALLTKYKLPKQSERDHLGITLGSQIELKRREQKAKEKQAA